MCPMYNHVQFVLLTLLSKQFWKAVNICSSDNERTNMEKALLRVDRKSKYGHNTEQSDPNETFSYCGISFLQSLRLRDLKFEQTRRG